MTNPISLEQMPAGITYSQITGYASGAIILNERNQILLMLRDDFPIWTGIGGKLEQEESFEQALHREVKEEIGLDPQIVREGAIYFSPLALNSNQYHCVKSYLCKLENDEMPILQDEGIYLEWFDTNNLPYNLPPKNKLRIQENLTGNSPQTRTLNYLPDMQEFSRTLKKENIYMFDFWISHPNVIKKNSAAILEP